MIYMMQNPRTTSVIGWSAVETLIQVVEAELYGETYDFKMLKQAAPSGVLDLGPGVPPEDVDAFRDYYQAEIAGEKSVAIFGGGDPQAKSGIQWHVMQRSAVEMQRREYMKWLATKISAVFSLDMAVYNLTEDQHRTTSERAQNLTDEGHRALALLVQEYITREIIAEFDEDHAFVFSDLNSRDAEAQGLLDERALKYGYLVPNEIRARDDLGEPLPYGEHILYPRKGALDRRFLAGTTARRRRRNQSDRRARRLADYLEPITSNGSRSSGNATSYAAVPTTRLERSERR